MAKLTTEEFIKKANIVHNGKYDYSKTDLEHPLENKKVIITCPIHGDFEQCPYKHLKGSGCRKCCGNIRKSKEEVIKEIKEIYGDRYIIPDDFEYKSNKAKFKMICPVHGEFETRYHNFIKKKHGCLKCSHHIYENNEFIDDIKKIYGDCFIYDEVEFKGYRNKVKLICKNCGSPIYKSPASLLSGKAKCDKCGERGGMSYLEYEVKTLLEEEKIKYVYQQTFEWLRYKQPLSVDFYLPDYNVAIECQGRFHYTPYKKDDEKYKAEFKKQLERDEVKKEKCAEHKIKIIYYTDQPIEEDELTVKNKNKIISKIK